MSAEDKLRELATKIADRQVDRILALEREKREIEAQLAQVQAYLDAARLANDRLADYEAKIGRQYVCPRCAIDRGSSMRLNPIFNGVKFVDKFRCKECRLEIDLRA